jgi:hypothetical protein
MKHMPDASDRQCPFEKCGGRLNVLTHFSVVIFVTFQVDLCRNIAA